MKGRETGREIKYLQTEPRDKGKKSKKVIERENGRGRQEEGKGSSER